MSDYDKYEDEMDRNKIIMLYHSNELLLGQEDNVLQIDKINKCDIKIIPLTKVGDYIRENEQQLSKEIHDGFPNIKNIDNINYENADLILLEIDGKVAGLAFMKFPDDSAVSNLFLHTVCIFKENRGKGYCRYFITAIVDYYRKYGSIELEVDRENIPAFMCYKKSGFIPGS